MFETLTSAIVLLPLLASVVGALGYRFGDVFAQTITTGAVTLAALLSLYVFLHIALLGAAPVNVVWYEWISTPHLVLHFGVWADSLTAAMFVVVTVVSACVHWFSVGYMADDEAKTRFFCYLSFFTFAMLALVSAPNLVQMFLGWEGVGVASYLLIGFWHHKESANAAAMKAFIINRVADVGLLLALVLTFVAVGSLDYAALFAALPTLQTQTIAGTGWGVVDALALLFFIGAMGKSAQLGFHTWLPDAMEGPTPVSALIHAATMVTAGVFLLCRLSPLYDVSNILPLVGWVGALTALFAATIGLVQRDIKRVIAYSTCSQLGYMFFAIGVGAYGAAMFHLVAHAFFKALLFLGAGSVIHAMHHEQDLFRMGALKNVMLATYGLMWLGSLALAGVLFDLPLKVLSFILPTAASSKELILEHAYMHGGTLGYWLYAVGTLAALLTAFYSFRLVFLAFHGKAFDEHAYDHAHESPRVMLVPMAVLAVGAVLAGFGLVGMADNAWWNGALAVAQHGVHHDHPPVWALWLPFVCSLAGIALAAYFYLRHPDFPARVARALEPVYALLLNKWYVDELYDVIIAQPVRSLANTLWQRGDVKGIDALGPNGVAQATQGVARILRPLQTGYVYHYAFAVMLALSMLLTWIVLQKV